MAKQRRIVSHESVTSAGPAPGQKTRGHTDIGLWVVLRNYDPSQDSVEARVEVSADKQHWAPIICAAPRTDDTISLSSANTDYTESDATAGTYVGYIQDENVPVEYVRANIVTYDDVSSGTLEVDTSLFIGGWTGRGKSYDERENVPRNQLGRGP